MPLPSPGGDVRKVITLGQSKDAYNSGLGGNRSGCSLKYDTVTAGLLSDSVPRRTRSSFLGGKV